METKSSLLYYRPSAVLQNMNLQLPGMDIFGPYIKLYGIVSPVDTTDTLRMPLRMKNMFPLPKLVPIKKLYEDICNERAKELLTRADTLGCSLYLSYSGGIDSTLALVSLLKQATPEQKKNITVLLSEESISENPNFYRDHIRGHLNVKSSLLYPSLVGSPHILINGELNDQIFGSDILANLISMHGPASLHTRYNPDTIVSLFNAKILNEDITRKLVSILERTIPVSGVTLVSNFDVLWWFNFGLKWQSVYYRTLAASSAKNIGKITQKYLDTYYAPFYSTEDFRLWSMNNMDKKIKDTWESYKWLSKDVIFAYNGDAEYRDHKLKNGSLGGLVRQQEMNNFIDDKIIFHTTLPLDDFFVPNNDFV